MPDAMPVRGAGRQRSGWDVLPRCRASGRGPAPLYPEPKSMGWIDPSGARAFRALDAKHVELAEQIAEEDGTVRARSAQQKLWAPVRYRTQFNLHLQGPGRGREAGGS